MTASIVGGLIVGGLVSETRSTSPSAPRESLASPRTGVVGAFQAGSTRTVYVSVTDKKGGTVADLQAGEFQLKEGGKTRDVVSARLATAPLRIALIVADGGTGFFQRSAAYFMEKLLGRAEISITSVLLQPEKVIDFSTDAGALSAGLRRIGTRARQSGAQLMEAIQEATKEVRSETKEIPGETKRPVIVVMRVGGEAPTPLSGDEVRAQLRRSRAILYVISTVGAQRAAPSQARVGISAEQAQLRDAELAEGAFSLAQVLGDGSKESGGRHDEVVSTTLVPATARVADELLHQYEITFVRPDGARAGDKLSVSSTRKDVRIYAPSRLPN